jgi:hypothetical protein
LQGAIELANQRLQPLGHLSNRLIPFEFYDFSLPQKKTHLTFADMKHALRSNSKNEQVRNVTV